MSYSTLARIADTDFIQMTYDNLDIREAIINKIINDPFDEDRDYVVSVFKNRIPYLKKMDDSTLK